MRDNGSCSAPHSSVAVRRVFPAKNRKFADACVPLP